MKSKNKAKGIERVFNVRNVRNIGRRGRMSKLFFGKKILSKLVS
jgi:hypothetical protein